MDSEKHPPTRDMLPAFRVKHGRAPSDDAVVRMKKAEYDDLLRREPKAALRYIDESDGEVILVGSSLELDQQLQEPVERAARTTAGVPLDLYGTGQSHMHSFEVEKEEAILKMWKELDQRTTEEGRKAQQCFFGRQVTAATTKAIHAKAVHRGQQSEAAKNQTSQSEQATRQSETVTRPTYPKRPSRQPETTASTTHNKPAKDVRFGQPSPPRSSLDTMKRQAQQPGPHADRWAAYSALPSTFDQTPAPGPHAQNEAPPRSAFDVLTGAATQPQVRSSTLQVPSTPKQKTEHQPLLETFWSNQAKAQGRQQLLDKEYQPLMDLFKPKLHQLSEPSGPSQSASQIDTGSLKSVPAPATTAASISPGNTNFAAKNDTVLLQTPGELLTMSVQSLLSGISQLASAFKLTNIEVQQQFAEAQKDFPGNIEKALNSSLSALDLIVGESPPMNKGPNSGLADRSTQASRPKTSDQATNTSHATREASSSGKRAGVPAEKEAVVEKPLPPSPNFNSNEVQQQNDRVDRVVEQMRLSLLESGWQAPASTNRIYTRADILEQFLDSFNSMKMQQQRPSSERSRRFSQLFEAPESPAKRTAFDEFMADAGTQRPSSRRSRRFSQMFDAPEAPSKRMTDDEFWAAFEPGGRWSAAVSGPSSPPKVARDDDKPAFDTPYAWDMDYSPSQPRPAAAVVKKTPFEDSGEATTGDGRPSLSAFLDPDNSAFSREECTEDDLSHKWKPLLPKKAQEPSLAPCSTADVSPLSESSRPNIAYKFRKPETVSRQTMQADVHHQLPELADEGILKKYPTVAQFEKRTLRQPRNVGITVANQLPDHERHTSNSARLSSQASMPALRESIHSTQRENGGALYSAFPFRESAAAERMPLLNKSASTNFRPTRPFQSPSELRRSNTTATTSNPSGKDDACGNYVPLANASHDGDGAVKVNRINPSVESCRKRLVEMGFGDANAANVSQIVKGDLEEAIDMLDEDANARKQWKGKGREAPEMRRHMPGAFDSELYG